MFFSPEGAAGKKGIKGKALFITTKNLDYLRNVQEIRLLKEGYGECTVIGSYRKNYLGRLGEVYSRLLFHRLSPYDLIWVGFAPQMVLPFLRKFSKKTLVIDFFISLYDTLCYDRKKVKPGSPLGKALYLWDKKTLEKADQVICDTCAHREYFVKEFGVSPDKCRVLYLEPDTSVFYPRKSKRPAYLKDKVAVLYFGSILPLQGVDIVLEAIELLQDHKELYFFLIGPMKKKMRKTRPEAENIVYIEWLPAEELAEYIGIADICLAGHFSSGIEKASRTIPGKAYIFQAMEKKIILGDNAANREIFQEGEKLAFVRMGDGKALADTILRLAEAGNKEED
ncbi:MAG: glycosyltransferase [Lachnospiraceae bacterium]|nr:glycosyltransferase [Lachnospiraceae bacterium]